MTRLARVLRTGIVLVTVVVSACAGASHEGAPASTRAPTSSTTAPDPAGRGTIASATLPMVPVTGSGTAGDVIESVANRLPINDEERACIVTMLDADPALLERARGGIASGTAEERAVLRFVDRCKRTVTFAQTFARSIPGATPTQQACLRQQFAALSDADFDVLYGVSTGANPGAATAPTSEPILRRLFITCGLPT